MVEGRITVDDTIRSGLWDGATTLCPGFHNGLVIGGCSKMRVPSSTPHIAGFDRDGI